MSIINSMLEMEVHECFLCLDDVVYAEKIDYKEYGKLRRLISLGMDQIIEGKLKNWDWKFMAKKGWLCEHDFEPDRFKGQLEKEGITKEDYCKNWQNEDYLK